jgi:hypothetical protein
MGSKMLSLQDNRLKSSTNKRIGWNFLMKRTKIKRNYVQFIVKISPPCSMHR